MAFFPKMSGDFVEQISSELSTNFCLKGVKRYSMNEATIVKGLYENNMLVL